MPSKKSPRANNQSPKGKVNAKASKETKSKPKEEPVPYVTSVIPAFNTFPVHKVNGLDHIASQSIFDAPKTVLTIPQMMECADVYTNEPIIRRVINTLVFGIKNNYIKFTVEPNEELSFMMDELELQEFVQQMESTERIPELKRKIIRVQTRVRFNERIDAFLKSKLVMGRGLLGIVRFPKNTSLESDKPNNQGINQGKDGDWPIYGEPRALRKLYVHRIGQLDVDAVTGDLNGIEYDYGQDTKRMLRPGSFIFGVHDDVPFYDNTDYSGMSPVWGCLSTGQVNTVINDENLPDAARQVSHKYGLIYTGTSRPEVTNAFRDNLEQASWTIHNQEKLKAEVFDLARPLTELPEVRTMNAKFLCQALMVPLFLVFEDTAHFATANQALQAWDTTVLKYYQTELSNILETQWYNYILADHYAVPVEDVVAMKLKIKPQYEKLVFDTYKDMVTSVSMMVDKGIMTEYQALKKLGEDKFAEERRELDIKIEQQMQEQQKQQAEMAQAAGIDPTDPNAALKLKLQQAEQAQSSGLGLPNKPLNTAQRLLAKKKQTGGF